MFLNVALESVNWFTLGFSWRFSGGELSQRSLGLSWRNAPTMLPQCFQIVTKMVSKSIQNCSYKRCSRRCGQKHSTSKPRGEQNRPTCGDTMLLLFIVFCNIFKVCRLFIISSRNEGQLMPTSCTSASKTVPKGESISMLENMVIQRCPTV